jgi:hypothetical protein
MRSVGAQSLELKEKEERQAQEYGWVWAEALQLVEKEGFRVLSVLQGLFCLEAT